jgi:hypothetical protein
MIDMKSEVAMSALICLVIGGVLGYLGAYTIFTPQINELSIIISDQTSQINTLESSNDARAR